MSGGAAEYVMGNYNDEVGNSGFSVMPDAKYYDKYTSDMPSEACNGRVCYSHALSETAGWYNDSQIMVKENSAWLLRNSVLNLTRISGIFSFDYIWVSQNGVNDSHFSFRLVLSPNL